MAQNQVTFSDADVIEMAQALRGLQQNYAFYTHPLKGDDVVTGAEEFGFDQPGPWTIGDDLEAALRLEGEEFAEEVQVTMQCWSELGDIDAR